MPYRGLFLAFLLGISVCAQESKPSGGSDLPSLLAQIPALARESVDRAGPEAAGLAKAIRAHGESAIPQVMALLSSDNEQVRSFAGYILWEMSGLTDAHLDALIAARRRGNGMIAPAIGRISSPRAVDFLIDELKNLPEEGQIGLSLLRAGENAVPGLVELYAGKTAMSPSLYGASSEILADMGAKATPAVASLLKTAGDATVAPENQVFAVRALGVMRRTAVDAVPGLKALAQAEPERFKKPVEEAITKIGTAEGIEIISAQLRANPSTSLITMLRLRDLAELREHGRGAGPAVVELLAHSDWELRVTAARTLGYIGYAEGVGDLRKLLSDAEDWRRVYCVVESLGRLKAHLAVPELQRVAATHWFPPVRDAAAKAVLVIVGKETYVSRWHKKNFALEFFDYQGVADSRFASPWSYTRLPRGLEPDALTRDELQSANHSIGPQRFGARCGLRVPGGVQLGSSQGEWGGELIFKDDAGAITKLVGDNTPGLHRMPFGVVAATGLAHLGMNHGYLYLVDFKEGEAPKARLWKALPGAPENSGVLKTGELFIACVGGNVLISPRGEITMAPPDLGKE